MPSVESSERPIAATSFSSRLPIMALISSTSWLYQKGYAPQNLPNPLTDERPYTLSHSWLLSIVVIYETFTALCSGRFGSPRMRRARRPAGPRCTFAVRAQVTTMFMRLRLNTSFWTNQVRLVVPQSRDQRCARPDPEYVYLS